MDLDKLVIHEDHEEGDGEVNLVGKGIKGSFGKCGSAFQ